MITTPSSNSAAIGGAGTWILFWTMLFHSDRIPGVRRVVPKKKIIGWVRENKILAISCTELINVMLHGVTNSLGVALMLGGTIVNAFVIWIVIPMLGVVLPKETQ